MTVSVNDLYKQHWFIMDQSVTGLAMNPMESFAIDDTLCRRAANNPDWGIARTWVHRKTVVLGIQDNRLPFINEGISYLKSNGYDVIVRNSGGLAVVLDEGVLNISLIFDEGKGMTIDHGYSLMVHFIRLLLGDELGGLIEDGEIKESYCPGRYDLSIGGRKFAGISQRRLRGGVAVQIYLAVDGSGSERAELIKQFYERAVQGQPTKLNYPNIQAEKMASISELAGKAFRTEDLLHDMFHVLKRNCERLDMYQFSTEDSDWFEDNLARMRKRNEQV